MALVAIVCMLTGTFFSAIHGTLHSLLTNKRNVLTPHEVLLANNGIGFLFFLSSMWWWNPFMEYFGFGTTIAKPDTTIFWIAAAWTAFWNAAIIQYAHAKSRQAADATLVTPYMGTTPGLITLSMLIFKEIPSRIASIGIGILSFGTYIHGRENVPFRLSAWRDWLKPFEILFKPILPENYHTLDEEKQREETEKARKNQLGVRWMCVFALSGTMGLLGDGIAPRHGEITTFYTFFTGVIFLWWYLIVPGFLRLAGRTDRKQKNVNSPYPNLQTPIRTNWHLILLMGLSYAFCFAFYATAFRVAPIAYIGTLKRFQIIMAMPLAWWILKERNKRRFITGAVITLGAILIGLDTGAQARILNSTQEYAYIIKNLFGFE